MCLWRRVEGRSLDLLSLFFFLGGGRVFELRRVEAPRLHFIYFKSGCPVLVRFGTTKSNWRSEARKAGANARCLLEGFQGFQHIVLATERPKAPTSTIFDHIRQIISYTIVRNNLFLATVGLFGHLYSILSFQFQGCSALVFLRFIAIRMFVV